MTDPRIIEREYEVVSVEGGRRPTAVVLCEPNAPNDDADYTVRIGLEKDEVAAFTPGMKVTLVLVPSGLKVQVVK